MFVVDNNDPATLNDFSDDTPITKATRMVEENTGSGQDIGDPVMAIDEDEIRDPDGAKTHPRHQSLHQ